MEVTSSSSTRTFLTLVVDQGGLGDREDRAPLYQDRQGEIEAPNPPVQAAVEVSEHLDKLVKRWHPHVLVQDHLHAAVADRADHSAVPGSSGGDGGPKPARRWRPWR